jgi:hypothetical protein
MALVATALVAAPAAAQQQGTMEFGGLARYNFYDASLVLDEAVGFGGRVGVFVANKWMLDFDFTATAGLDSADAAAAGLPADAQYQPFHLRLNFVEPFAGRGEMVIGAGYFFQYWGGSADAEDGLTGLFGLQWKVRGPWYARVDLTADYVMKPQNGAGDNWNTAIQVGIGARFGGM